MRSLLALCACISLYSAALADSRVFVIANEPDAYGVDQCLANGEKCGSYAAKSYCQSRNFTEAKTYRRIDAAEVTGTVPAPASASCTHPGCSEYVAITCER